MIGTRQRNKSRVGNLRRQYSALFRWYDLIAITLKYDGWYRNGRKQIAHVDFVTNFHDARGVSWRCGHTLQIIPPSLVLNRCIFRNKSFCDDFRKAGKIFPPVPPHERLQRSMFLQFFGSYSTLPALRVCAMEDQMAHALWVAHRIGNCNRTAL